MTKKLFLRQTTSNDEDRILDFLKDNRHKYIALRDEDVMRERVKEGSVTTLEDEDGNIKALSFSYPVVVEDENGNEIHKWTEIGTTHILMGGMGLFDILVGAQMLNSFLTSPPEDRFVTEIKTTNTHSLYVFKKMGYQDFVPPPDEMLEVINGTLAPEYVGGVDWLHAGVELMPELAQKFLDRIKNPKIVNKKTNEEFEIDVSEHPLGKHFISAVEKLAKHDLGDKLKPAMNKGLADASRKLNSPKKP